jgi:beta-aspartyl-peptidase (threonine type)
MIRKLAILILPLIIIFLASCGQKKVEKPAYLIVIHGGAGTIDRKDLSKEKETQIIQKLTEALDTGKSILEKGGSSPDAVEAAIRVMEDSPLFNAGRGSVFNELGQNEMDASIMDGNALLAGAVAGVRHIKNPISAARKVMTESKHVLLVGYGAEKFAAAHGCEMVDTSFFFDQYRYDQFLKSRSDSKHGTVGAVALDKQGHLAAGTSTGGMTGKMAGRVGDSPIIGAGTYANDKTCAVSCTGQGEFFMRDVVAYDISAMMEYKGWPLERACREVIFNKLNSQKASGGLIAVDKNGNFELMFNTPCMYRGYATSAGKLEVFLFGSE